MVLVLVLVPLLIVVIVLLMNWNVLSRQQHVGLPFFSNLGSVL